MATGVATPSGVWLTGGSFEGTGVLCRTKQMVRLDPWIRSGSSIGKGSVHRTSRPIVATTVGSGVASQPYDRLSFEA